ncbi:hypothetical protein [Hydrogenovibrio marinus]|uniref:Uncharacterized protein n=1 Tax=Hydrogenovibrio marinus TaxID=28885 RepID=A0A066ZRJ6_HYDMR|nr:hypothetical protein [Hydrogenovibrio marinus]KDN94899.1 hypothetical protein EI16_00875 [Hydrogenovibrio marinus]BBN59363.1 hypothetical protein HVMH_0957 [Hydrogenovibrio marinus]
MNAQKAKFTWHYYLMAFGALMAMLAATLSAWGGVVSALGFAVISHPAIRFAGVGRFVFLIIFAVLYVFAFPDPSVVKSMMASDVAHS